MQTETSAPVETPAEPHPVKRTELCASWFFQRLSRNGDSACVTIQKRILRHLRWVQGMTLIVEVMSDDSIRIRKPTAEDLGPQIRNAFAVPVLFKGGK